MRQLSHALLSARHLATWLLLALLTLDAFGQTKEETEAWIVKQTEVNPAGLKHSISDGALISHVTIVMNIGGLGGGVIEKGIPIGKITTMTYTHTNEFLSYTMTCDSPCAYLLEDPDTKRPKFLFEIYKRLDAGYVARMNKALVHLVRLHGGNATLIKAPTPKEPF